MRMHSVRNLSNFELWLIDVVFDLKNGDRRTWSLTQVCLRGRLSYAVQIFPRSIYLIKHLIIETQNIICTLKHQLWHRMKEKEKDNSFSLFSFFHWSFIVLMGAIHHHWKKTLNARVALNSLGWCSTHRRHDLENALQTDSSVLYVSYSSREYFEPALHVVSFHSFLQPRSFSLMNN